MTRDKLISFRETTERVEELEILAARTGRSRSNLLSVAMTVLFDLEREGKLDGYIRKASTATAKKGAACEG